MKLQGQIHAKDYICGWMHVTMYTKNCHSLIVFDAYEIFDTCHDGAIVKKGLQKTRFNDSLSVKFCTCQKKNHEKNLYD